MSRTQRDEDVVRLPYQVRAWLFTTARRLLIDAHRASSARPSESVVVRRLPPAVQERGVDGP